MAKKESKKKKPSKYDEKFKLNISFEEAIKKLANPPKDDKNKG